MKIRDNSHFEIDDFIFHRVNTTNYIILYALHLIALVICNWLCFFSKVL